MNSFRFCLFYNSNLLLVDTSSSSFSFFEGFGPHLDDKARPPFCLGEDLPLDCVGEDLPLDCVGEDLPLDCVGEALPFDGVEELLPLDNPRLSFRIGDVAGLDPSLPSLSLNIGEDVDPLDSWRLETLSNFLG